MGLIMSEHDRWLDTGMEDWRSNDKAYLEDEDFIYGDDEIDAYVEQQIEKECWYEDHPESGY
jgi:hypothetical protein